MEFTDITDSLRVSNANLSGSSFDNVDMSDTRFANTKLQRLRLSDIDLSGSVVRDADLSQVELRDCKLDGMRIDGIPVRDLLDAYRRADR